VHCSRNCRRRQRPFGKRRASLEPYVAPLEIGYLTLCFFASNCIALLYSTHLLIALSLSNLAIVIRQLAPFSRGYVDKRFLASLHLVGIHLGPSSTYCTVLWKQSKGLGSSRLTFEVAPTARHGAGPRNYVTCELFAAVA